MLRLPTRLLLAALAMASASSAHAQSKGSGEGDARAGKAAWTQVGCYTCHGYAAQGAEATGPQLAGRDWSFPVFNHVIRHPISTMPPYTEKLLSEQVARDLMAFVNSVPVRTK